MLRNSTISSLEESGVGSIDVDNKIFGVYVVKSVLNGTVTTYTAKEEYL